MTPSQPSPISRKNFLQKSSLLAAGLAGGAMTSLQAKPAGTDEGEPAGVYFASGCRVGEVAHDSAIIWTRLTAEAERRWHGVVPSPLTSRPREISESPAIPASDWEGAVPGAPGQVRIHVSTLPTITGEVISTPWRAAEASADFSAQFTVGGLRPGQRYYYVAEGRRSEGAPGARSDVGSFRTAPKEDEWADLWFAVVTCQMYYQRDEREGFRIYRSMANLPPLFAGYPDFIVETGDNVYYDRDNPRATTPELCRLHWQRMYSLPILRDFLRQVPAYWQKDDHDSMFDDSYPGLDAPWISPLTFEQGAQVFREQAPVGEKLFRTFRWGKGVQIWLPEGRDFRSPDESPDGPGKTLWGAEQKAWLKASLLASDAAFKILVSQTPIVGPDGNEQADNLADQAFFTEGNEFRSWVRDQGIKNFFVIAGDRHWQYASTDPRSGIHEFACGPTADAMVLKGPGYDPNYHSFYRDGAGFVSVAFRKGSKKTLVRPQRIVAEDGVPLLIIRIHDVAGNVLYEYRAVASG
ncbi:MAG TPA: alkaline phosphatase D family protein [Lacunisphaera sp.]|nr:alkaline phosphatase D family protein [Lacunisphaera sp.]